MIGYYKQHILALAKMVGRIRSSPEDLEKLQEFQAYLIQRILKTEKKLDALKGTLDSLKMDLRSRGVPKDQAKKIKKKIAFHKKRIADYKWLLYLWRCFGDAVLFIYLDKFAIKPFLYEFGSSSEKQMAGRLGGKEGLIAELKVVTDAIKNGVPAILNDLTNCIRHGDICLLGESDPLILEVKSSHNSNRRVDRQLEAISGLHEYLESDKSNKLFGVNNLKRMELGVPEVNFQGAVSQLVLQAQSNGFHHHNPEAGVHYLAIRGAQMEALEQVVTHLQKPLLFFLNESKRNHAWGTYYPFTLSIESSDALFAFLKGDVYILVILELGVIEELAAHKGWGVTYHESGEYALEFVELVPENVEPFNFKLSRHFLGRIAHEFLSLQWVMDFQEHNNQEVKAMVSEMGNA